jgi:hypothetical protein
VTRGVRVLAHVVKWLVWITEVVTVLESAWVAVKKLWDEIKPAKGVL